jgi:ABC-type cobalamin/Fe3+-siderophores transport system ATPase subunit
MTLSLHDLTYFGLLQAINLEFEPRHIYGILGPNGAGKSTLLKTMTGIWKPTAGNVKWRGENLLTRPRAEISRILSLVPQNTELSFDMTAKEMVTLGRYCHFDKKTDHQGLVEAALCQVDAYYLRGVLLSQMSGGEKQRIYLARALASEAPVLLLDEPTAHLDLRHQIDSWKLMRKLADQGKTIITTVHDLKAASRCCDKVHVLQQGRCVASGSYLEVMTPQLLQEVFQLHPTEMDNSY